MAGSGGRRNDDGLAGVRQWSLHGLGWRAAAEGLAGSGVELGGDLEQPLVFGIQVPFSAGWQHHGMGVESRLTVYQGPAGDHNDRR